MATCPACGGLEPLCKGLYCPVAESYTDRNAAALRTIAQACERGQCDASELSAFADPYIERERLRLASESSPKWRREFPDFDDMPALPACLVDSSWHNDTCPSFLVAGEALGSHVILFVDYLDKAQREFPDTERFSMRYLGDNPDNCVEIYAGDDWAEVLRIVEIERLAHRFACDVAEELTAEEWRTIRITNRTVSAGVCASHDVRDANEIMAESFAAITGRNLWLEDSEPSEEQQAIDCALWNAAWGIATPRYLTSDAAGESFDSWRMTAGPNNGVLILYDPGQIDVTGDSYCVTVSNLSELFDSLFVAESFLWHFYASKEESSK